MRPTIRNRLVSLGIRDYFELVKRALLVEQDIEETNQIQEQRGDRKGKQKIREVPRGNPRASNRGKEVSILRGILCSMQKVSRVLIGQLLLEYVMVVEQEITYEGLAHCGAYNRLDLSLREAPNSSR